jgi:hypothetical protein
MTTSSSINVKPPRAGRVGARRLEVLEHITIRLPVRGQYENSDEIAAIYIIEHRRATASVKRVTCPVVEEIHGLGAINKYFYLLTLANGTLLSAPVIGVVTGRFERLCGVFSDGTARIERKQDVCERLRKLKRFQDSEPA